MLKVKDNNVTIEGDGREMVRDLCVAAIAIRDIFSDLNDKYKSSVVIVSTIAETLGLKYEIKEEGEDA